MKLLSRILLVLVLFSTVSLWGQKPLSDLSKAPLVLVIKKSGFMSYPILFEETDSTIISIKNGDTTRVEYFVRYTDRRNSVRGGVRKTKITQDKISIWQNDTLRVEVKRQAEQHSGTLGGIKGKIKRELIPSRNPSIPASEQYMFDGDSLNFILYRPELGLVELESYKQFQYRRMIGHLFTEVCEHPSGDTLFTALNRNLQKDDEFQVLFNFQTLSDDAKEFTSTPNRLMRIKLGEFLPYTDPTQMNFKSEIIDLEYSTIFDETSSVIEFYDEGFGINQQIYLLDTLYPRTLKVSPLNAEPRMNPFYPNTDIAGPIIEATYERNISLGNKEFKATSYWNSSDATRLSFIPEFAFPWLDNAENFIGSPVYMKLGESVYGEPYQINENKKLHFARVQVTQDSLILEVSSNEKNNITIELQELNGTTIKQLKQAHGIRKGITRIPFEKLGLPYGTKADIVLITKEKDEVIEHQRFRYIQNN